MLMGYMEENSISDKEDNSPVEKVLSRNRLYLLQVREYVRGNNDAGLKESQYYFDDFAAMISDVTKDFGLDNEKGILEGALQFDVVGDNQDDRHPVSKNVKICKSDKEYYFLLRSFGWKLYYE